MRSWLDGVINGLASVKEQILALPSLIVDGIIDGIKAIFVPDDQYIQESFNGFLDELKMKFNIDTGAFESLFSGEKPVEDVYTDYNISGVGSFHLKVFDTSFLIDGVAFFRPFIRGFLVLMMLLYHIRQVIGFFGYDSGVVAGRTEHIKSAREAQK